MLLPLSSNSGPPKWVYLALVLGLLAVGGIALMAYKVLTTKAPVLVEQVQQVPAPQEAAKPAPAGAARRQADDHRRREFAAARGEPRSEGREGRERAEPSTASTSITTARRGKGSRRKGGGGDEKKGAAAAVAASEPAEKKPAKGSLDDLIDGAVSSRRGGSGRPKVSDDDKPAASLGPLSKSAVVAGMNSVKPKVAACYNQYKVQGMAMVNIVIGRSGKVTSAKVTGKFAGTPSGACVEKAVKSASFPPSEGLQTPYPFQLK